MSFALAKNEEVAKAIAESQRQKRANANEIRLQRLEWMDYHTPYHEVISICDRLAALIENGPWFKWKIVKELRQRRVVPQPCKRAHRRKRKK